MPALTTLQPIILLHRPLVPETLSYPYDRRTDSDPRDACVWVFEGEYNNSYVRYARFYATEVVEMLRAASHADLSEDVKMEKRGCITHKSSRVHSLSFNGNTGETGDLYDEIEVTLSHHWFDVPLHRVAYEIERYRRKMPAECVQIWPENRSLKNELMSYIDRLKSGRRPGLINFNPISIKKEQA